MSTEKANGSRKHALAAATALVIATSFSAHAAERINVSALSAEHTYDRFIVKYRAGTPERASIKAAAQKLQGAGKGVASTQAQGALAVGHVRRLAVGADSVRASRKLGPVEAEQLMRQIAADPNVEYVEIDQWMRPVLTPNDTSFSQQYGFGTGAGGTYATQAWDVTSGTGTVVAVLDTGIVSHSDLNANILAGYDFISDTFVSRDGNGRDSDASDPGDWSPVAGECYAGSPVTNSSWHGTHVAGTVAAVTNNAKGVAGMAYGAKVVPVRVLGRCGGLTSDIADAIVWASGGTVSGVPANANPAEVINMSLGGGGTCSATYQNAINGAVGRGTTIVVAAGNSNANVSGSVPANCSNVVAVASITSTGARSSFSNYGAGIDVAAPGSAILSTLNAGTTSPGAENYASYNGTSMAAPHVAGVVALMQARATTPMTPAAVESALKSTARAFPSTPSQPIGSGIVQARAAVDAAGGGGGGTGTVVVNVNLPTISTGGVSTTYSVAIPSGTTKLVVQTSGGTGDGDLYVRVGATPTTSSYTCRPYLSGNNETCTINNPAAGSTYFFHVRAYSTFSGVNLKATRTP
jgi:serine protease